MVGKRLASINVLSGRYIKKIIENLSKPINEDVLEINVKGKLIVIYFRNSAILATAGMAGLWTTGETEHRFKRIELQVIGKDNTIEKYTFCDQRNFGTFRVVAPSDANAKLMALGPDIFDGPLVPHILFDRLSRYGKKQLLCEALMDQRIFCGVGNYIRAEALFIAKLDPQMPAMELTAPQAALLWQSIHQVAVSAFKLKHKYVDLCYRRQMTDDQRKVTKFIDSNGRTMWYVPLNHL